MRFALLLSSSCVLVALLLPGCGRENDPTSSEPLPRGLATPLGPYPDPHLEGRDVAPDPPNRPPDTWFGTTPPDTLYGSYAFFRWVGADSDGDVVAFQYQLAEVDSAYHATAGAQGDILRSIDPPDDEGTLLWTDPSPDRSHGCILPEGGFYLFRVRSIDDDGRSDPIPARAFLFYRRDDIAPTATIVSECGRLHGVTHYTFAITASDSSGDGIPTPRTDLEYSYILRAQTWGCSHAADSYTDWEYFPDETTVLQISQGSEAPYDDFFEVGCHWDFTLRVRDPAGNISSSFCTISQL